MRVLEKRPTRVVVDAEFAKARREVVDHRLHLVVGDRGVVSVRSRRHHCGCQRAVVGAALVQLGGPVRVSLCGGLEQLRDRRVGDDFVRVLSRSASRHDGTVLTQP
nr:hypothetical protein [Halomicrobium mukohataei]